MSDGIGNFRIGVSTIGNPPVAPPPPIGASPVALQNILKSYLYQEYSDDDDLQAFVDAFNQIAQAYLDWLNAVNLPIYTSETVFGALLDWVAEGLYGISRPTLPSGRAQLVGPFNTYEYNALAFNTRHFTGSQNYYLTDDDVFRRIITWHFFKGDGKVFNVRWLKRRIMRFLEGLNGVNYNVDETYQVSVIFGIGNQVNITILTGIRKLTGGALFNRFAFNTLPFNDIRTSFTPLAPLAFASVLKAAIDSGALELPFQFTYVVHV